MANDLLTRLLLDSKGFDDGLQKSTKQIQDFQKKVDGIKGGIGNVTGTITKFIPQLAVLTGGIAAFNKTIESSESLSDAWGSTMEAATASVDSFFASISSGNFGNFLSGLRSVIDSAKEAYNAMDDLGTFTNFSDVDLAKIEAQRSQLMYQIKERKKAGLDTSDLEEQLIATDNQITEIADKKAKLFGEAYRATLKSVMSKRGYGEDYESYEYTVMQYASGSESWEQLGKDIEEREKRLAELRKEGYEYAYSRRGFGGDIEKGNIWEKEVETLNFLKAIADAEGEITEANKLYIQQQNEVAKAYNKRRESFKYLSDTEQKETKEQVNLNKELTGDFKANLDSYQLSIGFDNNAKKILSELPDSISEKLKQPFDRFYNSMEANKQLYSRGLISDEQYQNNELKYLQDFQGGIYRLMEDAVLRQDKKVMEEVIVPVLQSLGSKIQTYEEAKSFITKSSKYSDAVNSIQTSGFSNLGQAEAKLIGAKNLLSTIQAEMQGLEIGSAEWEVYNKMAVKMSANITAINAEVEAFKNLNNINKDLSQSLMATQSVLGSLGSTFSTTGDEGAAAFFNVLSATIPLISAISALAVAEGAEKAASSSKNWIEAIAATVALTGTIVAAIQAGRSSTKYANGGIVSSGSYSGDNNLVRVNGGEMILNGSQQANLFRMLNEGRVETNNSLNGQVQFRISGRDLVGTLNNYNSKYGKL